MPRAFHSPSTFHPPFHFLTPPTYPTMSTPLAGLKVIEIAGLAPAPFAGMVLADFGADVIRVDRATSVMNFDTLNRNKRSVALNLKSPPGVDALKRLCASADVVIEPFRPGVMEKLGLGPEVLCAANPKLIYARMTGFGQTGHHKNMAGHDLNYLSISGVLSTFGKDGQPPSFPINLLADFAGGGLMCAMGVLLALNDRHKTGKGQVIDAAMIEGARYLGSFVHMLNKAGVQFTAPRGTGQLDGGAPYYQCYKTKDGLFMAVGSIETQFYELLIKGLGLDQSKLPEQTDQSSWPKMTKMFTDIFATKTQAEWVAIFDLTDACVTPVVDYYSLETPAAAPRLSRTPAKKVDLTAPALLDVGAHSKEILKEFGYSEKEIQALVAKKAVAGAGLEKASL